MYTAGFPVAVLGGMNPGENATMRENRSPFVRPMANAYEAPSEKPDTMMRLGSMFTRENVTFSALSMNATSGP
jgi:hypothetical protein